MCSGIYERGSESTILITRNPSQGTTLSLNPTIANKKSTSTGTSDTLTIIYFFINYVFIYIYFYPHIVLSGILDPTSHPVVPRFRKPDNYLCSKAQKRPCSLLRRSATAPTGVGNLKNETHQESIFHDASEFVKRGLTIKRLRSAEFY